MAFALKRYKMIHSNLSVNENNHLTIAGADTVELAHEYGTPLMIVDEERVKNNMLAYVSAMKKHFGENAVPFYASKAFSCKYLYRLASEMKMGVDVVSSGELYTAKTAGFDMPLSCFHGNNKTDADIVYALENGIGHFVVDNLSELDRIDEIAGEMGKTPSVLLRLSPGIDPHTFAAVVTGSVDCKFGIAIETGQAEEALEYALKKKNISVDGVHAHIGSQIFDIEPFCDEAKIMVKFLSDMKEKLGFECKILNLGGGFGTKYVEGQPIIDVESFISQIAKYVKKEVKKSGITFPQIYMEPGRSIVADACLTVYTVGGTKKIPGFKNYVSVDGGMSDNPRYALYGSEYTVCLASRMADEKNFNCTVAGRCCESGDLIQENVLLPKPKRGDILAVLVTGAYNYSMASNYNRIPRPAVVAVTKDGIKTVIRRETLEDIVRNDI